MERAMERLTMSVEEAAELLGIGRSLAYQAARTGEIPTIRIGRRLLVPIRALEQVLLESSRGRPSAEDHGGKIASRPGPTRLKS